MKGDNGKAKTRLREIRARMTEIEAEVGRKYPGRNPVVMADMVSQEWADLNHEVSMICAQRCGRAHAARTWRPLFQALRTAFPRV
jgi:hypothetical protein